MEKKDLDWSNLGHLRVCHSGAEKSAGLTERVIGVTRHRRKICFYIIHYYSFRSLHAFCCFITISGSLTDAAYSFHILSRRRINMILSDDFLSEYSFQMYINSSLKI